MKNFHLNLNTILIEIVYLDMSGITGPEIVDVTEFLKDKTSPAAVEACKKLAQTLKLTSCVIIKDPSKFSFP